MSMAQSQPEITEATTSGGATENITTATSLALPHDRNENQKDNEGEGHAAETQPAKRKRRPRIDARPHFKRSPPTQRKVHLMALHDLTIDPDSDSHTSWLQLIFDLQPDPKDLKIIDKVPFHLRKLNEEAYTPQLVSIGPIHHGLPNLNQMEEQKRRHFKLFWSDFGNKLKKFTKFLGDQEKNIREHYAENLCDKFDREKLVEMMLLDSVFIMELFLKKPNLAKVPFTGNLVMKLSWVKKSIQRDLLLLENQIPLFILEELYRTFVHDDRKEHDTFIELALDYFACYLTFVKCDEEKKSSTGSSSLSKKKTGSSSSSEKIGSSDSKDEPPKHFTDLIRSFYICKDLNEFKKGLPLKTATKLQEAGVSFEKVINKRLLDINFKEVKMSSWFLCLGCIPKFKMVEARFEIPQLRIDHTTESVLRNIMALEYCYYPDQPYVCSYVSLFDSLIHTKEDVSLLVEKEVIEHTLGSDTEVETLVHDLGRNVLTNETCYKDMIDELDRYYKRMWWRIWWSRSMVELRLVYFRDLWRASSAIIGLFVFMFAILNVYQTIRSFYVVEN